MELKELKKRILTVYKDEFKKHGFNVSGNTFYKKESSFIKVFNIQLSQFNFYNSDSNFSFSYYLNLGIFIPEALNFSFSTFYTDDVLDELEVPIKPKISDCQFEKRANEILKVSNFNLIDGNTDLSRFVDSISNEMNEIILPFFSGISTLENVREVVFEKTKNSYIDVLVAFAHAQEGELEKAKSLIESYLEQ